MKKFEFLIKSGQNVETIEADDFDLDTAKGKLTFFIDTEQIASYATGPGAYVKLKK